jgi:hypothetical protein
VSNDWQNTKSHPILTDGLSSSFVVPPAFSDTCINKTFPTYINRRLGQRNLFLIYIPALLGGFEKGWRMNLPGALHCKNLIPPLIRLGSRDI